MFTVCLLVCIVLTYLLDAVAPIHVESNLVAIGMFASIMVECLKMRLTVM